MTIKLAQGRVLFDYLEDVVEGDQNSAIEEGEALEVDLANSVQVIKRVEFSPEDIEIVEGLEVKEVPTAPTPTPPSEPTVAATTTAAPIATTGATP